MKVRHYRVHDWSFGVTLHSPHDNDSGKAKHCTLNIDLFGHSWFIDVPKLFSPKAKWIDLRNVPEARTSGYYRHIPKYYGFKFTNDALFVYYGIYPGEYNSNDPENSDHVKLFWYPWRLEIVRHDLLYPNGDIYWRNTFKPDENRYTWYDILNNSKQNKSGVSVQVADYVQLEHYNKTNGELQKAKIRLAGEEREWRPKCTKWLPIFRHIQRVVDCESDIELGTRAGSWKGGRTGWSVPWEEGESMKCAFWKWYKTWDGN